jgi:hypothetical protein
MGRVSQLVASWAKAEVVKRRHSRTRNILTPFIITAAGVIAAALREKLGVLSIMWEGAWKFILERKMLNTATISLAGQVGSLWQSAIIFPSFSP